MYDRAAEPPNPICALLQTLKILLIWIELVDQRQRSVTAYQSMVVIQQIRPVFVY